MNTTEPTVRYVTTNGSTYAHVEGNTTHVLMVTNSQMANATARGGVSYDAFTVTARGKRFTERTRKAAVAAAIRSLRSRGFDL